MIISDVAMKVPAATLPDLPSLHCFRGYASISSQSALYVITVANNSTYITSFVSSLKKML